MFSPECGGEFLFESGYPDVEFRKGLTAGYSPRLKAFFTLCVTIGQIAIRNTGRGRVRSAVMLAITLP